MSKILVFTKEENTQIVSILKSINNNYKIKEKILSKDIPNEDFSDLSCIVLYIKEQDINNSHSDVNNVINKLTIFLKNNNVNSKIPIMPILYDAKLGDENKLKNFLKKQKVSQLNFLEEELIWFKTQSSDEFKNTLEKADYHSGYPKPSPSYNNRNLEHSDKSDIIAVWLTILLVGIVLGPIIGGLIGGLAIGGLVSFFIGAVAGIFLGPIATYILASRVEMLIKKIIDKQRTNDFELQKTLDDGNRLWSIFEVNFLPQRALSHENLLSKLNIDEFRQSSNDAQEPLANYDFPLTNQMTLSGVEERAEFAPEDTHVNNPSCS